jgi:putative transposase
MLIYKAQLAGIRVILLEESHTSKCSVLDLEPIKHHKKYLGRRVKRGLFKASDGRTIHADLMRLTTLSEKQSLMRFATG